MKANTARVLRALFWVYVAGTFVHIAYVVNREPFSFDAWNVAKDTNAKPATIGRFFSFWHQQYTTSNPRIGQPLTYLAYKLAGVAEIGTPLAFFAIVVAGFVLGASRWPSRRNDRDLAVLAIGIGFLWFMSPNLPAYMFCRAYATNYIWAVAIQLWFLVPLRLYAALPRPSAAKLAAYFVLGITAGMCNEHVGPTLVVGVLGYAIYTWRKHGRHSVLAWTAVVSSLAGFAIIFFAPGQSQRYEGLAEHYSAVQQILVRGITGNVDIFTNFLEAAAPLLLLMVAAIAIGMITEARPEAELVEVRAQQRSALAFAGLALLAGSLITITVFASPKLGPRFYLHAMALLLGGVLGIALTFLNRPRAFVPFVAIAIIASVYAGARTIPLYTHLAGASDRRLAELEATPRRGVYTANAWQQVMESWWTLGDDARDQKKQEMMATYFDLDRVLFRGGDLWKALGVTDVKVTMHYDLDPPMCLDEVDQLDLKPYVGRDIGAIHHAFLDALTETRRVTHARVLGADLTATFLGSQPPMPRPKMYIATWTEAGGLVGYTAKIGRAGRSHGRQIVLSPELKKTDFEMFVIRIGDPPRRLGSSMGTDELVYEPWGSGIYWMAACAPDRCFVVATVNHVI
jgi:Family of unknown function (DUF6056)